MINLFRILLTPFQILWDIIKYLFTEETKEKVE